MNEYPPTAGALMEILHKLRSPEGCPWDKAQTAESFGACFAGEAAELLDAIDRNDSSGICEECGDVLMNVFFQIVLAEEQNLFTIDDVWREIINKMVRRHAHIFGDAKAETPEEVTKIWLEIKKQEKGGKEENPSVLHKLPQTLSPLSRAEEIQKKVAKVGFDWKDQAGILDKIQEELDEVRAALASGDEVHTDEEIGDLLFAVTNLSRFRKRATADELLRAANRKFIDRFQKVEAMLAEQQIPLESAGIDLLEKLWQQAK